MHLLHLLLNVVAYIRNFVDRLRRIVDAGEELLKKVHDGLDRVLLDGWVVGWFLVVIELLFRHIGRILRDYSGDRR